MDADSSIKLQPPLPERGLSIRQPVLEALRNTAWPVVYLRSGQGSGKTVTASLYAATSGPTVWYGLDGGDNHLFAFVYHLGIAMRRALPDFRQRISLYPALNPTTRAARDLLEDYLGEYRRHTEPAGSPAAVTLIFDNAQVLDDPRVADFLRGLIQRAPAGLRLVFLGASPFLESAVFANHAESVRTLDDQDMRLSREEVCNVVGYDAETAWLSSQGWPAAVNAHRLFLQQHRDIDVPAGRFDAVAGICSTLDPTSCFTGILETLPESLRRFVLDIRLLEEMTAPQCNELAGIGNSAALLEYLVNNHYFMKKKAGGYYSFYPPFRASLESLCPPTTEEYRRAAQCLADTGNPLGAGRYAYLAGDNAILEDSAAAMGETMILSGLSDELGRWMDRLCVIPCHPGTSLLKAKLLLMQGKPVDAAPYVEQAVAGFREAGDGDRMVESMRYLALLLRFNGPCTESCNLIDRLLPEAAAVSPEAECLLLADKSCCLLIPDQVPETSIQIAGRLEAARAAGNQKLVRWYEWLMIAVHYHAGRYPEAVASRRAAEGITQEEMDRLGRSSLHYYAVRALQNMDERDNARRLAEGWRVSPVEVHALTSETWNDLLMNAEFLLSEMIRDRIDGRPLQDDRLDPLFDRIREYTAFFPDNHILAGTARVLELLTEILRGGNALRLAEEIRGYQNISMPSTYLSVMARVSTILLGADEVEAAALIVDECFERNEKDNLPFASATFYGLMACIAIRNRQETVAVEYVRASVTLAARCRMISLYADRSVYEPVINIAVDENLEPEFIRTVIDRFDYKIKKIYVNCFGDFYAAPIKAQDQRMHFRTNKTRELLALLLHNRSRAVTKSELSTALFGDDSVRNNKLLDVTIYYLRAAFRAMDLDSPVQFLDGGYSIFDNQIDCGIPAAANAILSFRRFPGRQTAEALLQAIPDVYMKDIDSPWASIQRDLYAELVHMARQTVENAGGMT